jgi:cyclic pyranopterin phosphate synthase
MEKSLSHINDSGESRMVDVSNKVVSMRNASAKAMVRFPLSVFQQLKAGNWQVKKGAILEVSRIAGIQGAKQTAQIIPLCHPLMISGVEIEFAFEGSNLEIVSKVKCMGQTGVEMEALTAVSVAALTVYDMCKALAHDIEIGPIQLLSKSGGKNDYHI